MNFSFSIIGNFFVYFLSIFFCLFFDILIVFWYLRFQIFTFSMLLVRLHEISLWVWGALLSEGLSFWCFKCLFDFSFRQVETAG